MYIKKLYHKITLDKWNIAFVENTIEEIIKGEPLKLKWLEHNYKDRWFADPFILNVTDQEIIVLVEEFYDPINRGRISKLTIDKHSKQLKTITSILELDSHLSFPAIWRNNNHIYIYPENSRANNLTLYEYNPDNDNLKKKETITQLPLTDAVMTVLFGSRFIFSTKLPNPNNNILDIYLYNNKKIEKHSTTIFQDNTARMAGDFFTYNNKIYRPAQVCNNNYGEALSIQEVTLVNNKFHFKEIRRLTSPNPNFKLGFHTFNQFKNCIVVDGRGYRNNIGGSFLTKLKSMINTFK